jgi:hypothetical protein
MLCTRVDRTALRALGLAKAGRRQPTGSEGCPVSAGRVVVVLGDGWKPLTTIQTPSESSHTKIGATAILCHPESKSETPNTVPVTEARSRGAPIVG